MKRTCITGCADNRTIYSLHRPRGLWPDYIGLAAEQRTKQIGIRKVLGASTGKITMMLSKEFAGLVVISTVLAAPIAYFAMQRRLERFAYHIDIGPGVFLFTGILTLAIAILTVSYQSVRAAIANPVKSLRS